MSVAYVVLAHRLPGQLARLCGRLVLDGHRVVVHVDARQNLAPFEDAVREAGLGDRVTWVRDRVRGRWGGYSLVEATLRGTRLALEASPDASHVVLLSGQDYPIKAPAVISETFESSRGTSFLFSSSAESPGGEPVEGNGVWPWADWKLVRMRRWHVPIGTRWFALPNRFLPWWPERPVPQGMRALQGSQWWALDREAAEAVVRRFQSDRGVRSFFRHVQIPDENAVQMVLDTTAHRDRVVQDDLHHISWRRDHPRDLVSSDVDALLASPKLFARKFDSEKDPEVLDAIDARVDDPRA